MTLLLFHCVIDIRFLFCLKCLLLLFFSFPKKKRKVFASFFFSDRDAKSLTLIFMNHDHELVNCHGSFEKACFSYQVCPVQKHV